MPRRSLPECRRPLIHTSPFVRMIIGIFVFNRLKDRALVIRGLLGELRRWGVDPGLDADAQLLSRPSFILTVVDLNPQNY